MIRKEVYIHRCYKNELGFRKDESNNAGRFIYIPLKYSSFFPYLSENVLNDNVLINIIDNKNNINLCNYVYHNSRSASDDIKKTRNEFRIYLNQNIVKENRLLKPDDILIFVKYKIQDELYYKIYILDKSKDSKDYIFFEGIFNVFQASKRRLNHLTICVDVLPKKYKKEILLNINEKIITNNVIVKTIENQSELFLDLEKLAKENSTVPNDETGLIKTNNFRDIVLFAYNYKCAVTQKSILFNGLSNLEAAHIMPQSHNGPNSLANGFALSRDLHWAFDKGLFTIVFNDGKYKVKVHDEAIRDNEILKNINNKGIFIPEDKRFRIHINALIYHKEHIYGSFKQIRSK